MPKTWSNRSRRRKRRRTTWWIRAWSSLLIGLAVLSGLAAAGALFQDINMSPYVSICLHTLSLLDLQCLESSHCRRSDGTGSLSILMPSSLDGFSSLRADYSEDLVASCLSGVPFGAIANVRSADNILPHWACLSQTHFASARRQTVLGRWRQAQVAGAQLVFPQPTKSIIWLWVKTPHLQ